MKELTSKRNLQIGCVFCSYCTSQLGVAAFPILNIRTWLAATILDSIAPNCTPPLVCLHPFPPPLGCKQCEDKDFCLFIVVSPAPRTVPETLYMLDKHL